MPDPRSTPSSIGDQDVIVSYNGIDLLPSPFLAWNENPQRNQAQQRENVVTTISLEGNIITLGTTAEGYKTVQEKRDALLATFQEDYKELVIRAGPNNPFVPSGTILLNNIFPRVNSITVPGDIQFNKLNYTVELSYDTAPISGISGVSNISNSWSWEEVEEFSARIITHRISAQGVQNGQISPLANVRTFVLSKLGLVNVLSGFLNYVIPHSRLAIGKEIGYKRSETLDENSATYSINEEFTVSPSGRLFVESQNATYATNEQKIVTVTLNGTIQGLGRNPTSNFVGGPPLILEGFNNALSGFKQIVQPRLPIDASGIYVRYDGPAILFTNFPVSISIANVERAGTITYAYTYTDDQSNLLPSGIVSSSCRTQFNEPIQIINFLIPFSRALGAIKQEINVTNAGTVQVQCSARAESTGDRTTDLNRAIAWVESELNRLAPNPADFIEIAINQQSQTNSEQDLSCTASISYNVTMNIDSVPRIGQSIT